MKTIVRYRLSEAGRKAALLAGVCADEYQSVEVAAGTPEFAEVVAAGKINGDVCAMDLQYNGHPWDAIPTVREILDDVARRAAEKAVEEQAKQDAVRAKILDVFTSRRVKTSQHSYGYGTTEVKYELHKPDWSPLPCAGSDDAYAIQLVPECAGWVAELEAANASARTAAEQKSAELKAVKEVADAAAKEAAEQAEVERRASLGLEDGEFDYAVEDGCIMRVPCYDTGRRSKNWAATISIDASKPGGLDRDFWPKAHGDAYYQIPASLAVGDAIEFGADSYSSRGRKSPERAYRMVTRIEVADGEGYVVMRKASSGKDACKAGAKFAAEQAKAEAAVA